MKTTIDIADPILREAKRLAARRNTTLREVVEQALRDAIAKERQGPQKIVVHTRTFAGRGLQPGLSWDNWAALRDLTYEGRGA
jgi:hypothetical protein